jgi:POT family proton-dependent oligopeptide transporter
MSPRTFLGQPRWFGTLFVVDMWERFSFYGMLAILYLYLVASPAGGGLGQSATHASALVGTYLALVFMAALPGGWLADRLLGARRATLYGGCSIAAGHLLLAVPTTGWLYPGLGLIVVGSGLVKPSMAAMVGGMYEGRPLQREAAFSVFYMSIQVSALFAPLITGFAAERVNWHLGFGLAGLGMFVGLGYYVRGIRRLGEIGVRPANPLAEDERRTLRRRAAWSASALVVLAAGAAVARIGIQQVLIGLGVLILVVPIGYLVALLRRKELGATDRVRLRALRWMLLASSVFWILYAQVPALFNSFAKDSVRRVVFGFEVPASWFQSVQPLLLLVLAPVSAVVWVRLGARFGTPAKFAVGLLCGGAAFIVMAVAAGIARHGPVSAWWLLATYLLVVCGELLIAPVGLSLAGEVAPAGFTARVLGLFWLFAAVGVVIGGRLAALAPVLGPPTYYAILAGLGLLAALAVAAAAGPLGRRLAAAPVRPDVPSSAILRRALTGPANHS